jgi:hypothetical protein
MFPIEIPEHDDEPENDTDEDVCLVVRHGSTAGNWLRS